MLLDAQSEQDSTKFRRNQNNMRCINVHWSYCYSGNNSQKRITRSQSNGQNVKMQISDSRAVAAERLQHQLDAKGQLHCRLRTPIGSSLTHTNWKRDDERQRRRGDARWGEPAVRPSAAFLPRQHQTNASENHWKHHRDANIGNVQFRNLRRARDPHNHRRKHDRHSGELCSDVMFENVSSRSKWPSEAWMVEHFLGLTCHAKSREDSRGGVMNSTCHLMLHSAWFVHCGACHLRPTWLVRLCRGTSHSSIRAHKTNTIHVVNGDGDLRIKLLLLFYTGQKLFVLTSPHVCRSCNHVQFCVLSTCTGVDTTWFWRSAQNLNVM